MVDILRKEVKMEFDEAVKHVQDIVAAHGFTVLLVKNIDDVIKTKLGVKDYPKYTTILACGADLAKMALDVSKDVGLLFPCSFVVYEENGKVIVAHTSIMKIAKELNFAPADAMNPVIEATGKKVQAVWEKL
ncbi:MAG: DUF302 domain-containing protein [Candidatus Hodarchaeales archaeon]